MESQTGKTDSITVYGEGLREANTDQFTHVAFLRAWERKGRGGGGTCQDLRCLPKTLVSARERVPSSKLSSCSIDVTPPAPSPSEPEAESAPIRTLAPPCSRVTSGAAAAILSVVSGSHVLHKCSSPGYQVVGSSFALRAPSKSAHPRRSLFSLKCYRCCCTSMEPERCLPFPTADKGPKGAATRDVKRGKLSGYPELFEERA